MNREQFVATRRQRWGDLEAAVHQVSRGRLTGLSAGDIDRFAALYRRTASDLAIARREFPDDRITEYLNSLCGRAHVLLNRGEATRPRDTLRFLAHGIPRSFRASRHHFLLALATLVAGAVIGWLAVDLRPDLRDILVPNSLFDQMARGDGGGVGNAGLAGAGIISNNIRVALITFVSGVLLGLPTLLVIASTGFQLGTLGAAVHQGGYDLAFWSLIASHGVLELSVILTAGAAGLRLADALLRPGLLSTGESLSRAAHDIVGLGVGTAALLVVAGVFEAFVSPSGLPPAIKIGAGMSLGTGYYAWMLLAGRTRRPRRTASLDAVASAGAVAPPA